MQQDGEKSSLRAGKVRRALLWGQSRLLGNGEGSSRSQRAGDDGGQQQAGQAKAGVDQHIGDGADQKPDCPTVIDSCGPGQIAALGQGDVEIGAFGAGAKADGDALHNRFQQKEREAAPQKGREQKQPCQGEQGLIQHHRVLVPEPVSEFAGGDFCQKDNEG